MVGVGLLTGADAPLPAQQLSEIVAERELEFRSAESAHESAVDARSAAERRFSRALQEIEAARESDDERRMEAAYARAQQQAVELQSLEQRVRQTAQRLDEARESLLDVLDRRLESLVSELGATPDPGRQEEIAALIRNLRTRVEEVERAGEFTEEVRLAALPEVTFDPRDGPVELRWKAELLQRRASQYEERIAEIDEQIGELRRRQRRDRNLQDLLAGIERFDDNQMPVGPPRETRDPETGSVDPDESEAGDTTAASGGEMTLEERIESLQVLRERIETHREQVLIQARQFRERAQEIS